MTSKIAMQQIIEHKYRINLCIYFFTLIIYYVLIDKGWRCLVFFLGTRQAWANLYLI